MARHQLGRGCARGGARTPLIVKNIREDPEALAELHELGYRATPVTVIGGEVVVGFDRGRIERLLGSQESDARHPVSR